MITDQQSRLDGVVSEFQKQFSESEERRRSQFTENERTQETRFQQLLETQNGEFDEFVEEQSKASNVHLDEIQKQKQKAEELVRVIANTGMVGGYQDIVNRERRTTLVWQVFAVVAFVGLIIFAIITFAATLGDNVSWQAFGGRAFVAAAFGVFAAYAARQASGHENVERTSRNLELALASIDPYLVGMPEEAQHQVKKELAIRFFGRDPAQIASAGNSEEVAGTPADLLRAALDAINNLSSRQP